MAMTTLADVQEQVQEFWSPLMAKELRSRLLIGSLINKDYQGEIKQGGDTVYVSQIVTPTGVTQASSVTTFTTETLATNRIAIEANQRAFAALEFSDLVDLQSQIGSENSQIRAKLLDSVQRNIDAAIKAAIVPHASTIMASTASMDKAALKAARVLAGQKKWGTEKPWYGLLDSAYYGDVLADATLASGDYNGGEPTVVSGQVAKPRFGFNLLEDSGLSGQGFLFHPDFMHLVVQKEVSLKVSDLHANKQFGYIISADVVFGVKLGHSGDEMVIRIQTAA